MRGEGGVANVERLKAKAIVGVLRVCGGIWGSMVYNTYMYMCVCVYVCVCHTCMLFYGV